MKIEDARKIIQEESLQGYNLCEGRENRENEVVLKKENEKCCYTQCAFNITITSGTHAPHNRADWRLPGGRHRARQ